MRKSLFPLLLLLPTAAFAASPECKHSQPRSLALDLGGVKTVVFDLGQHGLLVESSAGGKPSLQGKACASDEKRLQDLQLTQEKKGDKLLVSARSDISFNSVFLGNQYAYMKLSSTLPDHINVQLKVGSGDATVIGAPILSADVGSGDVQARNIRGLVAASVGSGDIDLKDIGALQVISVGSGDLVARNVNGNTQVGSIGSGDFTLNGAKGDVRIDSIGSGDAEVRDVTGNVSVGSLGSGDLNITQVRGDLELEKKGSGSLNHSGITGNVNVPRER